MKKKWIVIPCLLVLTVIGVLGMPIWKHLWQVFKPRPEVVVDRAMQVEAVDRLVAALNEHYIFPDKARQMEAVLRQRQQEGKYDGVKDGERLAKQLTADLHGVMRDRHMEVGFRPGLVLPHEGNGPPASTQAEWEEQNNVLIRLIMGIVARRDVEKVERLGSNIGYLKISGFPPPWLVAGKFGAAMDELAETDGLILDLRQNGGGGTESAALLISYFVDQRTRLNEVWDRHTGATMQHWTTDKLDGRRYGSRKPVFILVGPHTMSAGEDFAYTMQAMKRATVIGERTWGGANPAIPHRIGEHFFVTIAGRRVINPITRSNWEGVGVIPDIPAALDKALAVAQDRLQRQLQGGAALAAAGR